MIKGTPDLKPEQWEELVKATIELIDKTNNVEPSIDPFYLPAIPPSEVSAHNTAVEYRRKSTKSFVPIKRRYILPDTKEE